MRFNLPFILSLALGISSCEGELIIDEALAAYLTTDDPFFSPGGARTLETATGSSFVTIDHANSTLLQFAQEPLSLQKKIKLPFAAHVDGLLVGAEANYFVVLSKKRFAIIKKDGDTLVDPIHLAGSFLKIAFDPASGHLGLLDEHGTVGIVKLDATGNLESSFVGGSNFLDKSVATNIVMANASQMVAVLDNQKIAVLNLEETLLNNAYSVSEIVFPEKVAENMDSLQWWARPHEASDQILALTDDYVIQLNLSDPNATKFLPTDRFSWVNWSQVGKPHLVAYESGFDSVAIITAASEGAEISQQDVIVADLDTEFITSSYLSLDGSVVTLSNTYKNTSDRGFFGFEGSYATFRVQDSLFLGSFESPGIAVTIPRQNGWLCLRDSSLGRLESHEYTGESPETLNRFYLDELF